jgi:hypothetical protein
MKIISGKISVIGAALILAVFCSFSVAMAAEVSQGKCVNYDKEKKVITIEEYNTNFSKSAPYGEPTGVVAAYNVATAMIGIPPEPGDILRFAYDVNGTERVAIRVMNVSKQDLRKK